MPWTGNRAHPGASQPRAAGVQTPELTPGRVSDLITEPPVADEDTQPVTLPELEPATGTAPIPLVVILGPTACGKTTLSIPVARALNGEIISADSRQIYKYMDIGTAKPTPAGRAAVPHHLIDVVTPDETYTLAQYQRAAYSAIENVHNRGDLPLLVGGTGQYLTAVIEGWGIPEVPPNPDRRAELQTYADTHGAQALHDRLRQYDPAAADRIDYRNVRRVIRALEVYMETGTPITVLQRKQPPPYTILQLGLTCPREVLYERIDTRIDHMLQAGLLDEVRRLIDRGYTWDCPAMSGLGYGQWRPYLEGKITFEDAVAAIRRDTRAFVRRQYTWFYGHDDGITWLDPAETTPGTVIKQISQWLATRET
ncbi:MAG: tRNA (adenosine(37)-N6)-dimethylallyltransferase MiaA [Anaerolineae bacterium]|nr:tRNA (adenosine(37)-N6)-dimethylallyltransferase MiaA [Anaerolineae bacterium]